MSCFVLGNVFCDLKDKNSFTPTHFVLKRRIVDLMNVLHKHFTVMDHAKSSALQLKYFPF